jgi:structural maintenance of chromosomes protein 6
MKTHYMIYRSMSGGERSYATLALLLALGASHESPFRVMDEFDVSYCSL